MQSTAKMAAALKLSSEDASTVLNLRKELEKAWKLVDSGQEKVAFSIKLSGLSLLTHLCTGQNIELHSG